MSLDQILQLGQKLKHLLEKWAFFDPTSIFARTTYGY